MDFQATQNYIENQVKENGETSESSDNFPSLSSFMGLKSGSIYSPVANLKNTINDKNLLFFRI
jgi:hypothetical protein